jgi:hypothetical protein
MGTIETKREHGQLDTIVFSFRYVRLTENQKNEIEKEFKGTNANIETNLSKTNGYVVTLDLDKSIDPGTIKKLNDRLDIDETKFGVWISLTTYYDHSGLSFPKHVVDFIKTVGGQVDVSTIMISEDE